MSESTEEAESWRNEEARKPRGPARQYYPIPFLKTYRGPVLAVITPLHDMPFSLHNLHPGLSQSRFEGAGHWLHMDKPEEFNRLVEDFIAEIEKDTRG